MAANQMAHARRVTVSLAKSVARKRKIPRNQRIAQLQHLPLSLSVLREFVLDKWSLGRDEYELLAQDSDDDTWERIADDSELLHATSHVKVAGKFWSDPTACRRQTISDEQQQVTMLSFFAFFSIEDADGMRARLSGLISSTTSASNCPDCDCDCCLLLPRLP